MYFRLWGKVFCTHFAFISGNIKVYIFTPLKHCNVTLLKQHNCGQYHGEDFLGEKVARKSKKRSAARRAAFVPRHKKSRIGCWPRAAPRSSVAAPCVLQIHKYTNTQIRNYTNTQIHSCKYTKSPGSDIDLVHLRAPLPPCVLQIQIRKYTNTQKVFDRVLTLLCGGTMCACAPCVCATKLSASELQKATKQLKLTFGPIFWQMTSFSAAKFENKLRVGLPKISGVQPRKVYSPSSGQLWRVAQKVESVRALPRRCRCCPIHAGMRLIMRMRMMIMMMGTIWWLYLS